ncbi:MAG: ABC transporter ATP-binding protein, partial [bacterium]
MARLRVLWDLIRPFRGRLLVAALLTAVLTLLSALPPLVMQYLIDDVATKKNWHLMVPAVLFVSLLPVWSAWCTFLNRVYIAAIGQRLVVDLRTALYEHVLNLSMRFHAKVGAGPLMNRLMTDVGIVQNMVTGETLGILSSGGMLIFGVAMAFHINSRLAWGVILAIVLCALNYQKYSRLIRSANLELREMMDEVTGTLQERLAGVRLVKTYCRERDETNAFLASTDKALEIGMR